MSGQTASNPVVGLDRLLSASRDNYDACINHVDHECSCTGVTARTRLHHLNFDPNGKPKVEALAKCLAEHIMNYAVSSRNRPVASTLQDWARFHNETRRLLRVNAKARGLVDLSGEAGEMLLYFLLETVLDAPQVVAKIELKTNPAMEVNGSDGIHMRWHPQDQVVDVYFGESKLHADVGSGISSAFDSIYKFHANGMRAHELAMVTKHFKGADPHVKAAVEQILDTGKPGHDARINHACLIGYDWEAEGIGHGQAARGVEQEYRKQYLLQAPDLHTKLQNQFDSCKTREFGFEVFFLPFASVQFFRDAFKEAMS
ncbi:MAG: DUF1837 domain-containing protein [Phycisphaerales bacterium JB060]